MPTYTQFVSWGSLVNFLPVKTYSNTFKMKYFLNFKKRVKILVTLNRSSITTLLTSGKTCKPIASSYQLAWVTTSAYISLKLRFFSIIHYTLRESTKYYPFESWKSDLKANKALNEWNEFIFKSWQRQKRGLFSLND
jgi:hypothetical protein